MDADSLIALGAEHGCEFTAEDLAANVELSDEELDGVAGGLLSLYTTSASFKQDGTNAEILTGGNSTKYSIASRTKLQDGVEFQ